MASRNWDGLSPGYRKRLESAGVTRREYESGAPLSAARGHANTPERPERAEKNPSRYAKYRAEKTRLANEIHKFKIAKYGKSTRYNETRARTNIRIDPETGLERGIKDLRIIAKMADIADRENLDWTNIIDMDDDYESAFWYH